MNIKKADLIKLVCSVAIIIIACFVFVHNNANDNLVISMEPIQVVYITDDNYVNYLRTSIRSIIANKSFSTNIKIFVLGDKLSDKNIKKIKNEAVKHVEIEVIPIEPKILESFKNVSKQTPDVSRADNAKFFLTDILKGVKKVIYLDCDTIVLKDLAVMYYTNINDYYVAAVDDWQMTSPGLRYFNNGVMLMNLEKMRKDNVKQKLLYYKKHDKAKRFVTQDAFNRAMDKHVFYLPLYYNTFAPEFDSEYLLIYRAVSVLKTRFNPRLYPVFDSKYYLDKVVIIHYCGRFNLKPWYKIDFHRRTNRIWYRYAPLDFWIGCLQGKCKIPQH